jgi:multisubunit Na+/H+ antiporter MnhG subunit
VTNQIIGYLLIVLSSLLYLISGLALLAMVYALTVNTTIAAVESAFGSLVIGFIFFALAKYTFRAAKKRIKTKDNYSQE